MLQEKTKGNLLEPEEPSRRRSALRAARALRAGAARREAHHRAVASAPLRITFLGTGTSHGVPMIGCDCETCRSTDPRDKRWRASVYIETDDGLALLVDAGPDIRAQSLAFDIRRVDAIIFTHGHADHIMGLDDVRRFNALQQRAMPCYADEATLRRSASDVLLRVRPCDPDAAAACRSSSSSASRGRSASDARKSCPSRSFTAIGRFSDCASAVSRI